MDMDGFIKAFEDNFRSFILYLLSFFRPNSDTEIGNDGLDNLNSGMTFAIVSAVIGSYAWSRTFPNAAKVDDLVGDIFDHLMLWVSLGLLLHLSLWLIGGRRPIILSVLSAVKVFSVARVVSIYASIAVLSALAFIDVKSAENLSFLVAYGLDAAIAWIYFPREVLKLDDGKGSKKMILCALVPLFVMSTIYAKKYYEYEVAYQTYKTKLREYDAQMKIYCAQTKNASDLCKKK